MDLFVKKLISFFFDLKRNLIFIKKINDFYKKHNREIKILDIPNPIIENHKKKWNRLGRKVNIKWISFYTYISGVVSIDFIPENIYYLEVETRLNDKAFSKSFTDKNFYDLYFERNLFPKTIIRCIQGVIYNPNYLKIDLKDAINLITSTDRFVIKPSIDTGGGKAVKAFKREKNSYINIADNTINSIDEIIKAAGSNFVLQEFINQHKYFELLNPTSVNTVRILTYRSVKDEQIHVIHSVLRVGKPGSVVDNQASGGVAIGINDNGELKNSGTIKNGIRIYEINGVNISSITPIPELDKMKNIAKEIASKLFYSRVIGFDFCLDSDSNVRLIEINNSNNEINFFQMNNGPLFGEFTDEVIDFCSKSPVYYCLDYSL